jgi:non-ribosomal peptide synthetase component F
MFSLAIFFILLSKLTGLEDIIIIAPFNGRNQNELEVVIGMFVKTLYFRNYPGRNNVFIDFLKEVRTMMLEAYENQDYQPDTLVNRMAITRDSGRNPISDVGFTLQQRDEIGISTDVSPSRVIPYNLERDDMIAFDLGLLVIEKVNKFSFAFGYLTALFKEETIKRYIEYFKDIIDTVLENRKIKLKDIRFSHELIRLEPESNITDIDFEL